MAIPMVLLMALLAGCSSTGSVKVGDRAPDFRLKNQFGEEVTLAQYRGENNVVLYFYPKDNTSGCTAQACSFRDRYEVFQESGAVVLGVSVDSVESHRDFAAEHALPFQLLSDEDGKLVDKYGVSTMFGVADRVTFVIDRRGVVRHVFAAMFSPEEHIEEAQKILETLDEEYKES
jgi:peroxiredoxin Q/BCP